MDRVWANNASPTPPTMPVGLEVGYVKDSGAGTVPGYWWYHVVTESLCKIVEEGDLVPDASNVTQIVDAIRNIAKRMYTPGLSRTELALKATQGYYTSDVNFIECTHNTYPGDDGAASFLRISATDLNALGFSPFAKNKLAFQDASGDYWLLATERPRLAMVGCFGQPIGDVPVGNSDTDCRPYILVLDEYIAKYLKKPTVMEYGNANYYLDANTQLSAFTGITGPDVAGRSSTALDGIDSVEGIDYIPGLVLAPGASLKISDYFYSRFLTVKRLGIQQHNTMLGALNAQLTFTGTGVTRSSATGAARNVTIENFVAYGFAFGLDAVKMHGCRIGDIYGDCTTLVLLRNSGETCWMGPAKRKPSLTNNSVISPRSITVVSLFNSGGYVGVNTLENVVDEGLVTGMRVGNNKLPDAFVNTRHTATVLSNNSVRLNNVVWDPAYAGYALTQRSSISFQPQGSTAITEFYNSGGKVGVRTFLSMPFIVGHQALLGCGELSPRGYHNVYQVVNDKDFVLDVAWDAALLTFPVQDADLSAMPGNRRHSSIIEYWGTTEGFAQASVESDGVRTDFAHKGNSGFFCSSSSAHIAGSNEGGTVGELDMGDPFTRGLVLRRPRTRFTGDFKSNGIGVHIDMDEVDDVGFGYGVQLTDGGIASLKVSVGRAVLIGARYKGQGRILLDNPYSVDILEGDFRPENVIGTAAERKRVYLRWRDTYNVNEIVGRNNIHTWDDDGDPKLVMSVTNKGVNLLNRYEDVNTGSVIIKYEEHNNSEITLINNTSGVNFDPSAAEFINGFNFKIRNLRPAGDLTIPTEWGTAVTVKYRLNAAHTRILSGGVVTLTVKVFGTTKFLFIEGDTA